MFIQILNQVTEQIVSELPGRNPVSLYLYRAIGIWCNQLHMTQDITDYILRGCRQDEITDLTKYIYQEWQQKQEETRNLFGWGEANWKTKIYNLAVLNVIKGRNEDMKFIVLIAFGITAISYFIYILNQQKKQQTTRREEPRQYNPNPPAPSVSTVQTSPIPNPPVQGITKQFLVLVVSALQADFVESLDTKKRINSKEGESLYDITKYLWRGSESDFNQKIPKINRYSVSKGEESEYDIYLVYIELNQADEGFKPNVDQLARYDAFRKLADLAINLKISPRLQMEAYENLEVYNR